MRRKDLNVPKKAKKKIFLIKNPNTKKIYSNFRKKILKYIGKRNFAIGVSGGADSLCLAYLSQIYESEFGNKIHTIIVNHNIRPKSAIEAKKVRSLLKQKGIESIILNWKGKKPKKNIQFQARKIRYDLISNYCLNNDINFLITAHHQDDQIENFFIRLFRGSGLTGLSSMSEISKLNENLKIVRPLLNVEKKNLINITVSFFKTFIKDPSNEDNKFLRTRVRKYRKNLDREGLDTHKISKTVNNLLTAKNSLDFYKQKALQNNVNFLSKNICIINSKIFVDEAEEVVFRAVSDVLSLVSGSYYPPRSKKVINLILRLKSKNFKKSTLGGCIIEKNDAFILVSKEVKTRHVSTQNKH